MSSSHATPEQTNHDVPTIPGPQPRSFPLPEGVVECGDGKVAWLPANNQWPISVTSHHLALPRLLLRGCCYYATRHTLRTESNGLDGN